MRIVIDRHIDAQGVVIAEQVFHTETPVGGGVLDPSNPTVFIDHITFLIRLSGNTALKNSSGWNVLTRFPGEPVSITKWQRLLNTIATLPPTDPLRVLNLV